jgi:hypothetical protein
MTRSSRPLPLPIYPQVDDRRHLHTPHRRRLAGAGLLVVGFVSLLPSLAAAEDEASPMLLADVVAQHAEQLAAIDSDEKAITIFTTTVGPALGLKDAAGVLGAKRLPSKIVKELRLDELSESVSELMGALAAWQLAESVGRDANQSTTTGSLPAARQDWLHARSRSASLSEVFRLSQDNQAIGTSDEKRSNQHNTERLLVAQRTAFEASRQATKAWWDVHGWKDRIRQEKGLARLCGTWQWTIHNHQNHGDQKAVVMFHPAGHTSANAATPAETIVLGDAIYLRWEQNGRIQEDSLLFIKDDAKIEGSFVNNTGGWGSITGKRTAACQP